MKKDKLQPVFIAAGCFFILGVLNACSNYFQESPEQVAQKKCAEIAQVTDVIPVKSPITVFVNGKGYRCQ